LEAGVILDGGLILGVAWFWVAQRFSYDRSNYPERGISR
jgi:hypothetical protein